MDTASPTVTGVLQPIPITDDRASQGADHGPPDGAQTGFAEVANRWSNHSAENYFLLRPAQTRPG